MLYRNVSTWNQTTQLKCRDTDVAAFAKPGCSSSISYYTCYDSAKENSIVIPATENGMSSCIRVTPTRFQIAVSWSHIKSGFLETRNGMDTLWDIGIVINAQKKVSYGKLYIYALLEYNLIFKWNEIWLVCKLYTIYFADDDSLLQLLRIMIMIARVN